NPCDRGAGGICGLGGMAESDRRIVGACFALGAWLPGHHGDDGACADRRCRGSACGDRNLADDPESAAADHGPLRAPCIAPAAVCGGCLTASEREAGHATYHT